jgi:hypothetical protein
MNELIKKFLFVLLIMGVSGMKAPAATHTAASCALGDVANAIASASDGDIVVVPSASCPSTSPVTWGTNTSSDTGLSITKDITLECDVSGACYLKDAMYKGGSSCSGGAPLFNIDSTDNSAELRVTGFNITGTVAPANCGESEEHILVTGSNQQVRIDHNVLNLLAVGINWGGFAWGVVDHNTFNEGSSDVFPIGVHFESWNGTGYWGDESWYAPDTFGQAGALYVENNSFSFNNSGFPVGCFDEEFGGRIVFRFNTGCPFVGMHGLDSSGRARSGRQWEVYDNAFTALATSSAIPNMYTAIFLRGGTGFVFGNTFTDTGLAAYQTLAQLNSYRSTNGIYAPWGPSQAAEGCDGNGPFDTNTGTTYATGTVASASTNHVMTASGSPGWTTNQWAPANGVVYSLVDTTYPWGSTIISNTANTITVSASQQTGSCGSKTCNGTFTAGDSFAIKRVQACADQIGRGPGLLVQDSSGTNGIPVLASTGSPGPVNQALEPAYEWLNALDGATASAFVSNNLNIQQGRDYYDYTAAFSGASGVGSGTLANRPSTCTTGVGYWATDQGSWNQSGSGGQGELFVCTATNTWSLYYTPYAYPHPLVQATGTLTPPTNVTAVGH